MAKKELRRSDITNSRITILFFHLLLMGGLLWAERFAQYRYDYIFRGMLPWLLPVLFIAAAVPAVLLTLRICYKGDLRKEKIFSLSFILYLLIPLLAAFLFPWLSLFGKGLQLFKLAASLVFHGCIGHFLAYISYRLVAPPAGMLAYFITGNALALTYFYQMYLSPASMILNSPEFGYLTPWGMVALLAGLMIAALAVCLFMAKRKQFRLRAVALILPAILSLLLMAATLLFPALSSLWVRILIFGSIGLEAIWWIGWCIALKFKKGA